MTFIDAAALAIPVLFIVFLLSERLIGAARSFPQIRHWTLLGILGFLVTGVVNALAPALFVSNLGSVHALDFSRFGLWGAAPTIVVTTFITYWTHRLQHRFDLLWRAGHQLHHSVARVDVPSAAIFHPTEVLVQVAATTLASALLGVSAEAAALAGVLGFFLAVFQHWNVRTPRWLGWFIQRPEAHCLHHERDIHARNFGDITWWDMLFGTYANPAAFDGAVGFAPERGRRVLSMIAFIDVNQAQNREKL
jgi:sterol desaturase/sphingolipid hydroxylase (fatty acid hydroxylase superfamily)